MKAIADTGLIVAFGNRTDRFHPWAVVPPQGSARSAFPDETPIHRRVSGQVPLCGTARADGEGNSLRPTFALSEELTS